jgi:hypothetical protein
MDRLSPTLLLLFAVIVVLLVVVAFALVRRARLRPPEAAAGRQPAPTESEAELIDSSHVGLTPFVSSVSLPPRTRGDKSTGDNGA